MRIIAASLILGAASADYVLAHTYTAPDCKGDAIVTLALYPTGCIADPDPKAPSVGIGFQCSNASYGEFFIYPSSTKCEGTHVPANANFTAGCTNGVSRLAHMPAFGRFTSADGGSTATTCVTSGTPYVPAQASLSQASFVKPLPVCPASLYGAGNEINEIITYPGRKCIAVYGQKYSTLYDCNATTAFQNVYQGTSCAGRPISHLIADFTPNTCEGSGPGALDNYTTSCPFA